MFGNLLKRKSNGNGKSNGRYAPGNDHLIELRGVTKTFETTGGAFTALKSVDVKVDAGEFVAVIGKSGSGKSTLINMLAGIDRPTSGEVLVGHTAVHKLSEGQMAVWRGKNLGIVFQFFQLLPTLSLVENIMLPMDFSNTYAPRQRRQRAMGLLAQVDMTDHAHKLPSAISGGQQQRVAIARALANDPPILVADEPTGNLDSRTADTIFTLFESLVAQGKTILMVTHDHNLAKRVSRTIIISDGEVIEQSLTHALPSLSEEQQVAVTHHLDPERYAPGAVVIRQGEPADKFYIITKGAVDVLITGAHGQEIPVASMSEGQYFGEIELLRGGQRIVTVRASLNGGVEVAELDRDTFASTIGGNHQTYRAMDQIVADRLIQNQAGRSVVRLG